MTLVEFLLAEIAKDEQRVRKFGVISGSAQMSAVFNRLMAECEAKRRIIEEHEPLPWHVNVNSDIPKDTPICGTCGDAEWYSVAAPCLTLRLLALPYADRPDYREEWRA